jgi:hypothetical protein
LPTLSGLASIPHPARKPLDGPKFPDGSNFLKFPVIWSFRLVFHGFYQTMSVG